MRDPGQMDRCREFAAELAELADALSQAGVATQYVCFERQIHGFITMGRVIDEAHTALALCGHALKRHWAGV
jgi:acetyl esterase